MAKKNWLVLVFGVLVYLLLVIYADLENLAQALAGFQWRLIIFLFLLTTLNYVFRFFKWNYFLKKCRVRLGVKDNLFVFFSGLSMIITPGKIGEIWKGWLIKDMTGERLSKTVPIVIVERITDLTGLMILSLFGLFYFRQSFLVIGVLLLVLVAFFIAVKSKKISARIISMIERKTRKYSPDFKLMHGTFLKLMEPGGLFSMSLLSAFAWFFECIAFYVVIWGFGQSIGIIPSTFTFSFASLAGAVSMIPGGLGVAEATLSGFLQTFGLSATSSVGISMVTRFVTLWYGAVLGFVVYFLFKKR